MDKTEEDILKDVPIKVQSTGTTQNEDATTELPDIQIDPVDPVDSTVTKDLDKEVDKTLKDAGFNLEDIQKEIISTGNLTPDLIDKLKKVIDPKYIDAHLARFKAEIELAKLKSTPDESVEKMNTYIFDRVKGEKNFQAMSGYLRDNLPKSELDAINELLRSGDKVKVDIALSTAVQKYNSLKGKGKLMTGDQVSTEEFTPLTKDKYFEILRTEKYKTDRTYQKTVDAQRLKTKELDKTKYPPGMYFYHGSGGLERL